MISDNAAAPPSGMVPTSFRRAGSGLPHLHAAMVLLVPAWIARRIKETECSAGTSGLSFSARAPRPQPVPRGIQGFRWIRIQAMESSADKELAAHSATDREGLHDGLGAAMRRIGTARATDREGVDATDRDGGMRQIGRSTPISTAPDAVATSFVTVFPVVATIPLRQIGRPKAFFRPRHRPLRPSLTLLAEPRHPDCDRLGGGRPIPIATDWEGNCRRSSRHGLTRRTESLSCRNGQTETDRPHDEGGAPT